MDKYPVILSGIIQSLIWGPFPIQKWAKTSQNGIYHSHFLKFYILMKISWKSNQNTSYRCMKIFMQFFISFYILMLISFMIFNPFKMVVQF